MTKAPKLYDLVANPVKFKYARDGVLYYEGFGGWIIPVPLNEIGTGVLHDTERGSVIMKWARRSVDLSEESLKEGHVQPADA